MSSPSAGELSDLRAWDARLETGVRTIDLQHRILFDLLLGLRDADRLEGSSRLARVLAQLKAYASYHFHYEEAWVREHSTDHLQAAEHARLHASFDRTLAELDRRLGEEELDIDDIRVFLQQWLIGHIVEQDLPMIHALKGRSHPAPGAARRGA